MAKNSAGNVKKPLRAFIHPVGKREQECSLGFGGIGKEYASDRLGQLCRELGVEHALINLGGDIHVVGPQPEGRPWSVGVVHPRKAATAMKYVQLFQGALATSGDYERFFEIEGRRYCHILNPKTGYPVEAFQAVSILAESCLLAGGLATCGMLLGLEKGRELFRRENVPYLVVDREGRTFSSGDGDSSETRDLTSATRI